MFYFFFLVHVVKCLYYRLTMICQLPYMYISKWSFQQLLRYLQRIKKFVFIQLILDLLDGYIQLNICSLLLLRYTLPAFDYTYCLYYILRKWGRELVLFYRLVVAANVLSFNEKQDYIGVIVKSLHCVKCYIKFFF